MSHGIKILGKSQGYTKLTPPEITRTEEVVCKN